MSRANLVLSNVNFNAILVARPLELTFAAVVKIIASFSLFKDINIWVDMTALIVLKLIENCVIDNLTMSDYSLGGPILYYI